MNSKNRFCYKAITKLFFVFYLIACFIANTAWASGTTSNSNLLRRIVDRLSLIYFMDGDVEKSIALQKEIMNKTSKLDQNNMIKERGSELVRILEARGEKSEAKQWHIEIFGADTATSGSVVPSTLQTSISKIATSSNSINQKKQIISITPRTGHQVLNYETTGIASPTMINKTKQTFENTIAKSATSQILAISEQQQSSKPAIVVSGNNPSYMEVAKTNKKVEEQPASMPVSNTKDQIKTSIVEPANQVCVANKMTTKTPEKKYSNKMLPTQIDASDKLHNYPSHSKKVQNISENISVKDTIKSKSGNYTLQAPSLLPEDIPHIPVRDAKTPRQLVVGQLDDTSKLANISPMKVTLNFRDAEIADIVRLLASKANLNIISRKPITGRTTVNFENIPVGVALETILRHNDYVYELRDGIIWVSPQGDEPLETRVFFIRNVPARDLADIVTQNLKQLDQQPQSSEKQSGEPTIVAEPGASGGGAGSVLSGGGTGMAPSSTFSGVSTGGSGNAGGPAMGPSGSGSEGMGGSPAAGAAGVADTSSFNRSARWYLQVDERSNSLIVTAPRRKLDEISRLLEIFDVPMDSRRMEERIFKLKYIDQATLEKAIKMVLPHFDPQTQMLQVKRIDIGASSSSGPASGGVGGSGVSGGSNNFGSGTFAGSPGMNMR